MRGSVFVKRPKVTVLMTLYNDEKYLKEAIESILNQTYKNFEFLIILEAGSTDNSLNIIKSYKDRRIRLVINEEKLGFAESLNKGIRLARGKYIARMDADDISLPKRLEYQVKFMDKHENIVMCGTNMKMINDKNEVKFKKKHFKSKEEIRLDIFFSTVFAHPTVMFRRKKIIENNLFYSTDFKAEDYELWSRIVRKFDTCNIQKYLVLYRVHSNNSVFKFRNEIRISDLVLQNRLLKEIDIFYELSTPLNVKSKSLKEKKDKIKIIREIINKNKDIKNKYIINVLEEKFLDEFGEKMFYEEFGFLYTNRLYYNLRFLKKYISFN